MEARFRGPRNPLEWLLAICILGVVLALGMVLMGVVIVAVAVALVAGPIVGWWRRRQVGQPPRPTPEPDIEIEGPVVDAEFEVREDSDADRP